jgi:hypothetical protein
LDLFGNRIPKSHCAHRRFQILHVIVLDVIVLNVIVLEHCLG